MEKIKHHLCIILDKSGSMVTIRKSALRHANEQIQTAKGKQDDFDIKVTFITFNYDIDILKSDVGVDEIYEIPLDDYRPNGGTALNDAVGIGIEEVMSKVDLDSTDVLFAIVSDGEENSSTKYPRVGNSDLAEKVQTMQEKFSWTFTYIGTDDFDLAKAAKMMNIPVSNVRSFARSANAVQGMSMAYCSSMDEHYSGRVAQVKCSGAQGPAGPNGETGECGFDATKIGTNLNFFEDDENITTESSTDDS